MTETELTAAVDAEDRDAPLPPSRTKRSAFLIWIACLIAGVVAIWASVAPLARW